MDTVEPGWPPIRLLDTHILLWWLPEESSLAAAQAREVAVLPWHQREPFDRMLIAQARATHLKLLTADEVVAAHGEMDLLAGRLF